MLNPSFRLPREGPVKSCFFYTLQANVNVRILDPLGISDVFEDYEGFYGKKDSLADKEDKF